MKSAEQVATEVAVFRNRAEQIGSAYLLSLKAGYEGRYSVLADPDTLCIIFKAARAGLKPLAICEAAGINPRTLARWHAEAEAHPEGPHALFVGELKALRRQGQVARLEKIEAHGDREWTALAWLNERTDQEQFALQKDKSDGPPLVVTVGVDVRYVQVRAVETFASSSTPLALPESL